MKDVNVSETIRLIWYEMYEEVKNKPVFIHTYNIMNIDGTRLLDDTSNPDIMRYL